MKYKEIEKRSHPRFSGVKTFFRCPQYQQGDQADTLIFGVPFDGGTTYRSGARMAPSRVRDISALGRGYDLHKSQDVFKKLNIYDGGDIPVNPISLLKTYKSIEDFTLPLWQKKLKMLFVGGDHSITLPLLRSCFKQHGPLNLIHFDAHYDTYPPAYGEDYHHGTFVRHAVTEKLVQQVWQFGIRGPLTQGQDKDFVDNNNIRVFYVDDIKEKGRQILSQLPKVIQGPTYLSFDVDCLDPAFAPGTGTPMVGGLSSYEAKNLLKNLQIEHLVAADVVEVNPSYDHGDITSLVAADVLLECLHLMV
ncbi:MAG: agmatinase [Bdellovibrionales bacterium]